MQIANPLELPLVAALGGILLGPTQIVVNMIKSAAPRLPGGALPLIGVVVAYGLGIVFEVATGAQFTAQLYAQVALAALVAQGGAMVAKATTDRAESSRIRALVDDSQRRSETVPQEGPH